MNKEYLQHDYYTDIITFDYSEDRKVAGEMYISYDRVVDNAKKLNIKELDELHRVIIHGVLHLCGYKDKTKKDEILMRSTEDKALNMRPLGLIGL
jgi:rRNA maturation RNase YbeY